MRSANPAIIPRNYRVEEALSAAVEDGNLQIMHELLAALREPFAYTKNQDKYAELPPPAASRYRTFCGT